MISSIQLIHAGFFVAMVTLVTIVTFTYLNLKNLETKTEEH